jgi:ubiquinone/menaquinone biosynthesis C-methylase UbiE
MVSTLSLQKSGILLASLDFIRKSWDKESDSWSINSKEYLTDFYKNLHDKDLDYFNLLFENKNTKNSYALEYACGWGRNIKNFSSKFKHIDGCDISEGQIKKAKSYLSEISNYSLFLTDGKSVNKPDSFYGFAYSTLSISYITSKSVRDSIFKDIYRVLDNGGTFSFQIGIHPILSPELSRVSNIYMYNDENLSSIFNRLDIGKEENIKKTLESIGFKNYRSKITGIKDDFYEGLSFKTQIGYDKFLWISVEK